MLPLSRKYSRPLCASVPAKGLVTLDRRVACFGNRARHRKLRFTGGTLAEIAMLDTCRVLAWPAGRAEQKKGEGPRPSPDISFHEPETVRTSAAR